MTLPKFLARRFNFNTPFMIRFDEKHGRRTFLINNEDDIRTCMFKIFKERKKQGYYGYLEEEQDELVDLEKKLSDLNSVLEILNKSPELLKAQIAESTRSVESIKDQISSSKDTIRDLLSVENKTEPCDEIIAFMFKREDYEYEQIEVDYFEKIKGATE